MNQSKTYGLKEVFKLYPYIKKHEGNQTRPSLKGCTINPDHELSMTWRQWHELIKIYLKYCGLYLISGLPVTLPHRLGIMQLMKRKGKPKIDIYKYVKTGAYDFYKNNHTSGYYVSFKWFRSAKQANFKTRYDWHMILIRTLKKKISQAIFENPNLLLSYDQSRKANKKIRK